jgi:hypothetical protein
MLSWVVISRSTLRRTRKSRAIHPFRAASFAPTITSYPSVSLSPIFRTLFQVPYPASPLFATLTKTPGVWGYSSHFETVHASSMFKYSDLQMFPRVSELSPFFSNSCALFCTLQKINSFIFNSFRTLSQKPPGVGGTPNTHIEAPPRLRSGDPDPVGTFQRSPIRPIAAKRLWCNNPQRYENSLRSGETTPLPPVSKNTRADIGDRSILVPFYPDRVGVASRA